MKHLILCCGWNTWWWNKMLQKFMKWLYYRSQLVVKGNTWWGRSSPKPMGVLVPLAQSWLFTPIEVLPPGERFSGATLQWELSETSAKIKTSSWCLHVRHHSLASEGSLETWCFFSFALILHCSTTLGRAFFFINGNVPYDLFFHYWPFQSHEKFLGCLKKHFHFIFSFKRNAHTFFI